MDAPEDYKYCVAFSRLPDIGPARFRKIKSSFGTFENAWKAPENDFIKKAGFEEPLARKISSLRETVSPEEELESLGKHNIELITAEHELYPKQLSEIASAPYVLFYVGNADILSSKQVGIVGPRAPSQYGKLAAEKIAADIARAGLTVTSGMAHGIDSIAHRSALSCHGKTVAVLGAGIFEASGGISSKRFIDEIVAHDGIVISEYHPVSKATKFTFPARNRIISGLSSGILIVEAGKKSGALITARYAIEHNRDVFAIPGSIFSEKSVGTHSLIKQGAQLVSSSQDILEALNFIVPNENTPSPSFENEIEKVIYSRLSFEPIHIDALARLSKVNISELSSHLSLLELRGFIKNIGGGMIIKK